MASSDEVVFAVLAKQKAAVLSLYLRCLLNQTYDKKKIHLYIRTNDSTDNTEELLRAFVTEHGHKYASVFFDSSSISERLKAFAPHEWNSERFRILGRIRQDSVDYAIEKKAHYFVADCDNFIVPTCLEKMVALKALGVVAPMLNSTTKYLNMHYATDANGYLKNHPFYDEILYHRLVGCVKVDVVHCTYFVNVDVLRKVCYDDNSYRYEYVIFSDSLRKAGVGQYYDNREFYGFITFAENAGDFDKEVRAHWMKQLAGDFGIDYESIAPFKESYSLCGEDKDVIKFYDNKEGGFFVAYGFTASENNVYLLEKKYGWKGVKGSDDGKLDLSAAPDQIDYLSLAGNGEQIVAYLNAIDMNKHKFGYITISGDFVNDGTIIYAKMIDNGYIYVPRDNYDVYIHKSMFEGSYYLNGNKSLPHQVTFCNITNTLTVKSDFHWEKDIGILCGRNMLIRFHQLGDRAINYNSITLHQFDKWIKT
jgi:hypothetical protein